MPDYSVSDHFPIAGTYRLNNVKTTENQHTRVSYRRFKNNSSEEFHNDLQCQDLKDVELCIHPNESLKQVCHVINTNLSKHAPYKRKAYEKKFSIRLV